MLEAAERWVGELTSADWAGIAQLSSADAEHAALARLLDRQLGLDWGQGFLAEAFAAVEQSLSAAGFVIVDEVGASARVEDAERLGGPRLDEIPEHVDDVLGGPASVA